MSSGECSSCKYYDYEEGYCSWFRKYYDENESCNHWEEGNVSRIGGRFVTTKCGSCEYYENNEGYCSWFGKYYDEDESCNHWKEGNSSSGGGCFLTTACCEYKGLPDNCYELETLRNFRDTYLVNTQIGEQLIKLYYDNAPSIVDKLNTKKEKAQIYDEIYNRITYIIDLIEKEQYEKVVGKYIEMVMFAENMSKEN